MSFNSRGFDSIFQTSAQFEIDESEVGKIISQRIALAKSSVLLDYPFFGYIVGKLNLIPTASESIEKYCIDFSNLYFSTNYVKNLIEINPEWKERLKGDLIHLVLHLVYDHVDRKQNRDDKVWGFAADIVIFQMMKELSMQMNTFDAWGIPSFSQIPIELLNLSTEKTYLMILDNLEKEGEEEATNQSQKSEDLDETKKFNEAFNQIGIEYSNHLPVNIENVFESTCDLDKIDNYNSEPDQIELNHSLLNGIVRDAYERSKVRGELPGGMILQLDDRFNSRINWRVKLSNFLQKAIPVDTTWRRPNRKHISSGHYFPSTTRENINLLVAIDTSGSVDEIILTKFLSEIRMIMDQLSNTRIIFVECDAEIQSVTIVNPGEKLIVKSIKGRGGTDFRPVFKLRKKYDVDVVIYFTDGEGLFPEKSILDTPVLWILTKESPMPFGSVILL